MRAVLLTNDEFASLNLPTDRPPPRIVLGLEGGVIQGFSTNGSNVEVTIIDYDESFDSVRQSDGAVREAGVYRPQGVIEPEWVNAEIIIEDEAA
jgi:hypothetical protein